MKYFANNLEPNIKINKTNEIGDKDIVAYVDGSFKDRQNNGYGVAIYKGRNNIYNEADFVYVIDENLCNLTSVKTELVAVLRAIQKSIELNIKEIIIVYDCKAITDILSSRRVKSEFSYKYRKMLEFYSTLINIKFKKKTSVDKMHNKAHNLARSTYISA